MRTARELPALLWDFVSAALVFSIILRPGEFSRLTVATTVYGLLLLEPLAGAGAAAIGQGLRRFGAGARTWTVAFLFTFLVVLLSWVIDAVLDVPGLFLAAMWLYLGKLSEGLDAKLDVRTRGELLFGVGMLTGALYFAYLLAMIGLAEWFGTMVTNDRGELVVDRHSIGAAFCGAGYFVALGLGRIAWRRRVLRDRAAPRG